MLLKIVNLLNNLIQRCCNKIKIQKILKQSPGERFKFNNLNICIFYKRCLINLFKYIYTHVYMYINKETLIYSVYKFIYIQKYVN